MDRCFLAKRLADISIIWADGTYGAIGGCTKKFDAHSGNIYVRDASTLTGIILTELGFVYDVDNNITYGSNDRIMQVANGGFTVDQVYAEEYIVSQDTSGVWSAGQTRGGMQYYSGNTFGSETGIKFRVSDNREDWPMTALTLRPNGDMAIGNSTYRNDLIFWSPDGTEWACAPDNSGNFTCT